MSVLPAAELTADDLLSGPRGRGVCLAVAHRLHDAIWPAWLRAARQLDDPDRRSDLVSALRSVDAGPVREWTDPELFVEPVAESVGHAMYWQPPHDEDVVAADPAVVAALRPVAVGVSQAPGTDWWTSRLDAGALRRTVRGEEVQSLTGAGERLVRWRAEALAEEERAADERPADPAAMISGRWWSTPALVGLANTTRPFASHGSVESVWQEDTLGHDAEVVQPVRAIRPPRVYEIAGPTSWTALVERYPLEVTWSRRHDWYRTTAVDGRWLIPDWFGVAADWDAVHLSVAGYLSTAGRALPLTPTTATVLAGWSPDQTWWLADVLEPVRG